MNYFMKTEQLAKDLELFAQHAGRKSVNMEDVILSGTFSYLIEFAKIDLVTLHGSVIFLV